MIKPMLSHSLFYTNCMKIIILLFGALVSCISKNESSKDCIIQDSIDVNNELGISEAFTDSLVYVYIPYFGILKWNNITGNIERDSLYKKFLSKYENNKLILADKIGDETETQAISCGRKSKLLVGDLVFLLIMDISKIPNPIHSQLDVFEKGCPYPASYFDVISKDRLGISARVKAYLSE
jgi:hypothetical protein